MKVNLKVQCISTSSGFYNNIKLGEWYDVYENYNDEYYRLSLDKQRVYSKGLFKTLEEKREEKLNKILN